jgi:hypothetical protein
MNTFKITVLGASDSGKTCFMLAMYKLMNNGRKGFSLTACKSDYTRDPDKKAHNELIDSWNSIVRDKQWVAGSGGTKLYSFSFEHADTNLVYFDFMDYRGGILKNDEDDPNYKELIDHLMSSQIIMCCVPGGYWNDLYTKEYSTINAELDNIKFLFRDVKKKKDDARKSLPPVIILTTKYDECQGVPSDKLNDLIQDQFTTLFSTESEWLVSIMKTTLGEDLALSDADLSLTPISPKWVVEPIVFSIYFIFSQLQKIYSKNKDLHAQTAQNLGGGLFDFWDWWNSDDISLHNSIAESYKNQQLRLQKYTPIVKETFFPKDVFLYHRGNKLTFEEFVILLDGSGKDISNLW